MPTFADGLKVFSVVIVIYLLRALLVCSRSYFDSIVEVVKGGARLFRRVSRLSLGLEDDLQMADKAGFGFALFVSSFSLLWFFNLNTLLLTIDLEI
jgi:hypothetical protein